MDLGRGSDTCLSFFPVKGKNRGIFKGQIDPISFYLILFASVMLVFLQRSSESGFSKEQSTTGVTLIAIGLVLGLIYNEFFVKVRKNGTQTIDTEIKSKEAAEILAGTMMTVFGIIVAEIAVPKIFNIKPFFVLNSIASSAANGVFYAVAEEVFFRYLIASVFIGIFGVMGGILISSLFWTGFHVYVYPPVALAIVFVSGLVVGYGYYTANGRLTSTILPHVIINIVAVMAFTLLGASV